MLGSTLIDVVNETMSDTKEWIETEMNLSRAVACAEVKGVVYDEDGCMKCGFLYSTMIATGAAESDEEYCNFLQRQLHDAHLRMNDNETIPEMSWESSPVVMKHIQRNFGHDRHSYSIVVAALGGTREENETIVNSVINSIPEIG